MPTTAAVATDDQGEQLVPVKLPSGGVFWVYGREVKYWNDRVQRYMQDNHFTNIADLQVLDRIIMLELFAWRWGIWVSQQHDYWHEPIDEKEVQRQIKDASAELRALTSALGIDKVTRDKVRGEDSTAKFIENLKIRAREFGVMRENQLAKAIELFQELKAKVTLLDGTTDDERLELNREMPASPEEILRWVREEAIPMFDAIDDHFKKNQQRFWIREQ